MEPWHLDDQATIYHGDCIDVLRALPDASVDSVVTDPPYALNFMGKSWDDFRGVSVGACEECGDDDPSEGLTLCTPCAERLDEQALRSASMLGHQSQNWSEKATHSRGYADNNNAAFQRWCELWAVECLRVLKPGGHLLAFGGTRTWHRLAVAIEDAGFEIRDSIAWMYGSGFPKSLDVSKAIDKRRIEDKQPRVAVTSWVADECERLGWTRKELCKAFGVVNQPIQSWTERNAEYAVIPTWDNWLRLRSLVGFGDQMDAEVWRLNGRKGSPGESWTERPITGEHDYGNPIGLYEAKVADGKGRTAKERRDIPATPDAARWQGWGTALKPAHEPVVVARKPLTGTVAANVLEHETGALNIDGCRIGMSPEDRAVVDVRSGGSGGGRDGFLGDVDRAPGERFTSAPGGRWPANVVLDEDQAAALDKQSGVTASSGRPRNNGDFKSVAKGTERAHTTFGHTDQGGASRFFYVAKAPARERPKVDGIAHPTVKPLTLMRWLCRLVTPPGGVVLEPFAGSGTTIEAALMEGFRVVAIEREPDYLPLIAARLERVAQEPDDGQLTFDASA